VQYQLASLDALLVPSGTGGSLLSLNTERVQLTDTRIISNAAQISGGGIHMDQSWLDMEGSLLQNNQVGA
jgi:hypothetical protein